MCEVLRLLWSVWEEGGDATSASAVHLHAQLRASGRARGRSSVTAASVPAVSFGTCLTALLASQNCAKNKSSFTPSGEDIQKTLRERLSCELQLRLSTWGR